MSRRHVSQREAARLRKQIEDLESKMSYQRGRFTSPKVYGASLGYISWERNCWLNGRIEGARLCGCVVVVTEDADGKWSFYAVKP